VRSTDRLHTYGFDGEKFDAESTELTVRIASKPQSSV
jgi:hypothetical protein